MVKKACRQRDQIPKHCTAEIHHHAVGNPTQAHIRDITHHPARQEQRDQREWNEQRILQDGLAELMIDQIPQQRRQNPFGRSERHHAEQGQQKQWTMGAHCAQ